MNAANDITAIRAKLPYFDRRALSQAWFSAFHLAGGEVSAGAKRVFAIDRLASDGPLERTATMRRTAAYRVDIPAVRTLRRPALAGAEGFVKALRRSERALAQREIVRYAPPFRASFTLTIEGARVQILLRREGASLHVVALCTRRHVELVRRALACADVALRAQGECVRSSLRPVERERGA